MDHELIRQISEHWKATKEKCGDKWNTVKDRGHTDNEDNPYGYKVDYGRTPVHDELIWCAKNCEGRFYRDRKGSKATSLSAMRFEKEVDAVAFKLRWI